MSGSCSRSCYNSSCLQREAEPTQPVTAMAAELPQPAALKNTNQAFSYLSVPEGYDGSPGSLLHYKAAVLFPIKLCQVSLYYFSAHWLKTYLGHCLGVSAQRMAYIQNSQHLNPCQARWALFFFILTGSILFFSTSLDPRT